MRTAMVLCLALMVTTLARPAVAAVSPEATQKLFQAVEINDLATVKASVSAGADLEAKNAAGMNAADLAVDKGHFIIAHYLLSVRPNGKRTASKPAKAKPSVGRPVQLAPKPPSTAETAARTKARAARQRLAKRKRPRLPFPRAKPSPPGHRLATGDGFGRFGEPPRKPATPLAELDVARAPGVDGTEPEMPAEIEDDAPSQPVQTAETDPGPLDAVGSFFQSLVDLVTPDRPDAAPALDANEPTEVATAEPGDTSEALDSLETEGETDEAVETLPDQEALERDEALLADPDTGDPQEVPQLDDTTETAALENEAEADTAAEPETEGEVEVVLDDSAEADTGPPAEAEDDSSLLDKVLPDVPSLSEGTTKRTLDRLKNVLAGRPEEDENGLPILDTDEPAPAPARRAGPRPQGPPGDPLRDSEGLTEGQTDVVEIIDEGPAEPSAEAEGEVAVDLPLDDRPARSAEARQPLEVPDDDTPLPKPGTLRERLKRMNEALSREVKVDPMAILRDSRSRGAQRLSDEQGITTPLPRTVRRRDYEPRRKAELAPRTDPASRYEDRTSGRVARLRQQEYAQPDPTAPAPTKDKPEPSLVERMAGLFTGEAKKQAAAAKPAPSAISPAYERALSKMRPPGEDPDAAPARDLPPPIANIHAFAKKDEAEVKPGMAPGKLSPGFLDKLAGVLDGGPQLSNEAWNPQIRIAGAAAEVMAKPPAPSPGASAAATAAAAAPAADPQPWTTTVQANTGEGQDPVIVQVTETPGIEVAAEATAESPDATAVPAESGQDSKRTQLAKAPFSDPLRPPDGPAAADPLAPQGAPAPLGRLTQLYQPIRQDRGTRDALLLGEAEKLSTADDIKHGGRKRQVASLGKSPAEQFWPITDIEKTSTEPLAPAPRRPVIGQAALTDVNLTLGESVNLDNAKPPGENAEDPKNECIKKNRATTLFCVRAVDWPENIAPNFVVPTILYTGTMAIVRFDQGEASRMHSLFPSDEFDKVVDYYQKRFGEPTQIWKRSIAPLAQPRRDNPTVGWRSRDPETNAFTVLEVRKFDDMRGGFPDTARGAVTLYYENAPNIFPQVSAHELMRLNRGLRGEAPAAPGAAPAADTAPAGPTAQPDELGAPDESLQGLEEEPAPDASLEGLEGEPAPDADTNLDALEVIDEPAQPGAVSSEGMTRTGRAITRKLSRSGDSDASKFPAPTLKPDEAEGDLLKDLNEGEQELELPEGEIILDETDLPKS